MRRRLVVHRRVDRGAARDVLSAAGILPQARYVVYFSIQQDWWDSIDMADALHPQTLIAYAMNGGELPVGFGGPLRLRVPRQLGYKSVKYINRLTVTDSLKQFGKGLGRRLRRAATPGTPASESPTRASFITLWRHEIMDVAIAGRRQQGGRVAGAASEAGPTENAAIRQNRDAGERRGVDAITLVARGALGGY